MSRGLGRVEKAILEALGGVAPGYLTVRDLAAGVFAVTYYEVTRSQHSAAQRALSTLQKKGRVVGDRYEWSSARARRWRATVE